MRRFQFALSVTNQVRKISTKNLLITFSRVILSVVGFLSVPSSRSLLPDIAVSAHIDRHCKSDPALKKRNRCSVSRCKQKEFVKILCEECELNFCLKHRHKEVKTYFAFIIFWKYISGNDGAPLIFQDHKCQGSGSKSKKDTTSRAGVAALQRAKQTNFIIQSPTLKDRVFMPRFVMKNTFVMKTWILFNLTVSFSSLSANFSAFQGGLNEDEALKRALQRSIQETIGKYYWRLFKQLILYFWPFFWFWLSLGLNLKLIHFIFGLFWSMPFKCLFIFHRVQCRDVSGGAG